MQLTSEDIGKFVAIGGGFSTHGEKTYRWPDLWVVPPEAVINENQTIQIPENTKDVTPAAELTAIIGDELWQASQQEAWDGIKGFTISNDVTSTGDWPGLSDPDFGNVTGVGYKIFPTFSPILSDYVSRPDMPNEYDSLSIEVYVDGECIVSGSTADLAFSIPELVSFASSIVKLNPNDVVALGDPGNPEVYLDNADEVSCYIEKVGELTNPVEQLGGS